jgi:hypothetical protein
VSSFEELLGGNATTVQAGAADFVTLDQGNGKAGRGAVEGGGVSTRSPTNNDDVKQLALGSHVASLRSRRTKKS